MFRPAIILGSIALAVALFSCRKSAEQAGGHAPPDGSTMMGRSTLTALADPHLENAHRVTDTIFSGAQPEDEDSFKALAALGIKTLISVDGARPDAASARKYGMRYVHLPIGYNGVTHEQGVAIAKALRELPAPFYVHCHHGKHRSAAAVAVACVYNGALAPEQVESVLYSFGTGANYTGLWRDARNAAPLDPAAIRKFDITFVETAPIPPLADAMVAIDRHWEHLRLLQKNNWQRVTAHPDLDPPHEALQLQEHFTEIARTDAAKAKPQDFQRMVSDSEAASASLRNALITNPIDPAAAAAAFKRIGYSCAACHKSFRD